METGNEKADLPSTRFPKNAVICAPSSIRDIGLKPAECAHRVCPIGWLSKTGVQPCWYTRLVSAVLMIGLGGRIGGQLMPRVQLPVVAPKRRAWNKGRIIGQKRPLLPKQVWAIRARLELAGNLRDLALFNVAIDSKLRGCDLVKLTVTDLVKDDHVRERVSVTQSKTKRPVQF